LLLSFPTDACQGIIFFHIFSKTFQIHSLNIGMNLFSIKDHNRKNLILEMFDPKVSKMFKSIEHPREIPSIKTSEKIVQISFFALFFWQFNSLDNFPELIFRNDPFLSNFNL